MAELSTRFRAWPERPWSYADFDDFALRVFEHQHGAPTAYRRLCDLRGVDPSSVSEWGDIPAVPATAFKHFDLASVVGNPEAVFYTSGTTSGLGSRGRHPVPRLDLYRASLIQPARLALMPDSRSLDAIALVPRPEVAPTSSLSFMVGEVVASEARTTAWLVRGDGSWDETGLRCARELIERGRSLLVLGTTLSLAHALEGEVDAIAGLPERSRIMDTGGSKGLDRTLSRADLKAELHRVTGVPPERIVGEYGMTELLSQLWEPVLTEGSEGEGVFVGPPWLRVRALDPVTLDPLPEGEDGVLSFFDLANLGSVSHIITQDIGSVRGGRVKLRGREVGAEPRGCSRAMDELMTVARDRA